MMMDRQSREEPARLNLGPIMAVVFSLLLLLLAGFWFAEAERDLVSAAPSEHRVRPVAAVPRELVVDVQADGRLLVSGVEFAAADLERFIARAAREYPDQAVVIRGDTRAGLERPGAVLSLCEKHGIRRTYLTTLESE
jgi:biopolymer transport protein ExbD